MEGEIRDRALLARYYASADVLVHGSAAETYGLVVAEAICSGLPVVVPDRGGAAKELHDLLEQPNRSHAEYGTDRSYRAAYLSAMNRFKVLKPALRPVASLVRAFAR